LTPADRWDHILARWGYRRDEHRVAPGLYALGRPTHTSPVFVTANYTLSFDALRSALEGVDSYILVLDTQGINVWCAAGKGTFGTDEVARRVEETRLAELVSHRRLILPQLGAPGVAAHEVRRRTGFRVEYGPVRAADLPAYLQTGEATPEMRRVRFDLRDRLVLIPVELVHVILPTLAAVLVLFLLLGPVVAAAAAAAVLAGTVLFPILLPWIPAQDFSSKGFVLGTLVVLPFAALYVTLAPAASRVVQFGTGLAILLALPPVTAYLALNFTGATTFASRSGVKREMRTYIPLMAVTFGSGVLLALALATWRWIG
jgi:hypothetical protein